MELENYEVSTDDLAFEKQNLQLSSEPKRTVVFGEEDVYILQNR